MTSTVCVGKGRLGRAVYKLGDPDRVLQLLLQLYPAVAAVGVGDGPGSLGVCVCSVWVARLACGWQGADTGVAHLAHRLCQRRERPPMHMQPAGPERG